MAAFAAALALLAAGTALPAAHGSGAAQEAGQVDVIDAGTDRHDRMTVPVRIGNAGPFDFLIDTGSQNTVISTSLAQRLALSPDRQAMVVSVAGRELRDTVVLDELGLGSRSYYGLVAPLLERAHIGADGIVGIDSLQDQRVLIDFTRNVILIDEARRLGGSQGFEIVVKARRRHGQLIMTDATIDRVRVQVVIDTGAESSIGNRALQRALAHRGKAAQATLTSVTGQTLLADIGYGRRLSMAGMDFENVIIAFADSPAFMALGLNRKPALLLGMAQLRLFKRVAIDFPTRQVLFDVPWEG